MTDTTRPTLTTLGDQDAAVCDLETGICAVPDAVEDQQDDGPDDAREREADA